MTSIAEPHRVQHDHPMTSSAHRLLATVCKYSPTKRHPVNNFRRVHFCIISDIIVFGCYFALKSTVFLRNSFSPCLLTIGVKVILYSGVCIVCDLTFDWRYLREQNSNCKFLLLRNSSPIHQVKWDDTCIVMIIVLL